MIKSVIWLTIIFLLGGIALITYYTSSSGQLENGSVKKIRYAVIKKNYNDFSMQQLDSISAASNYSFAKYNAEYHSLIDTTSKSRL